MAFGKGAGIAKSTNYVLSWGSPFMSTARSGRKREPQANIQPQALCDPKAKIQNPKSEIQNPKSKTQKSKTQNPKPNIQNPKTKILNVKRPPRAGKPTTFKASNRCRQRVAQADSVLLRPIITSSRPLPAAGAPSRKLATSTFIYLQTHYRQRMAGRGRKALRLINYL